ncbi:MAG: zinc-dependent alcohol dehydrogenase family protein [Thalassospira sp.]|uniref:zinc-dependent alcohol dehydrogenase family protein n=1 Tax=Thalassospira sp. 11-3 TaxID=2135614 RepID=UPI000D756EDF|nr:zinc-dependent alcohol dehydrogenase family protein [Thalassospira sp. 11-3]MBL4840207.1 zinc-dependent alcohol dehydrogenase family protein [Thalassospira sp.]PXX30928.1 alcohol dehydrogenase [Thalassospira sp. 11-3]
MRAAFFTEYQGPIEVRKLDDPTPENGGVVIKVGATGLCRSDWHGWMGHDSDVKLPHVPGHEFAGTIEAVGKDIKRWKVGDRVTVPFVSGCGHCPECHSGNYQVCDHQFQPGFTHWGSFAEYVAIDYADTNLVRLPDEMDFATAASLGCRFATSFRGVIDQGKVSAGQIVAVHGCGGVGLSAIMIAAAAGARVIAVDIDDAKLDLARELGAIDIFNAKTCDDIPSAIKDLSGGGAHVSVDALGSAITSFNSVSCLRKRGKHIQIGLMTGDHAHARVPMDRVVAHELEILGSHGMQAFRYDAMIDMIMTGKLAPQKLIRDRVTLAEGATALMNMDNFVSTGVTVIDRF